MALRIARPLIPLMPLLPRKAAAPRSGARAPLNALGLRWKITALLAGGCAVVAAAIGLLIHHARLDQVAGNARSGATAQLVRVRQLYELTGQVDQGDTDAVIDAPDLPAPLRRAALAGRRATYLDLSSDDPCVWAARPVGGRTRHVLSVRVPLREQAAEVAEFDRRVMLSGGVVVALAALGGAGLSSRLSRELRTAAAIARRISQGELDARINHPRPPGVRHGRDEVAELATAVDTMAASLQQRLEAEQRFTADVAHELRTPLTGLHTAAELLPPSRPTELVRDRVDALRALTEDLLEVARLDAEVERPDLETHPLGRLVEAIAERAGGSAAAFTARGTQAAYDTFVRTDVRRLERILTNLVANARRHGGEPVEVWVEGTEVTVRDHGPGFPECLLRDGPQRFQTGARERGQGTGLGLTIAFGQAQVIGARIGLSNAADGGAVAAVSLPRA
ncbi:MULTISPECIES: sensor histidine kinase [Streptomyces]|uniref:sensor histidine kinase n=1 Tax=Streptomyces TaxID=1883 RepID=UPI001E5D9D90|nr:MULTISPECIES: HAMP domain-containing sensor histidine kinase [Streptomyces]UFQ15461.1 HAMP domain-containing histidine kinase [Streptomyces huasconensis]WCL85065.1 HAMP domain-containing sensor histidine kinase [Streptomyces sp. JCM 35825]